MLPAVFLVNSPQNLYIIFLEAHSILISSVYSVLPGRTQSSSRRNLLARPLILPSPSNADLINVNKAS